MCGITGIASLRGAPLPEDGVLRRMNHQIIHRGPDEDGFYRHGRVAMAMRRLSIIDLSSGRQPISNEDNSVHVVFNGEIYNFRELRRDLEARGHRFRTNSDTEVIVHSYEEYGLDFPRHLNGMFAISLHDRNRERLVLARDHIGIKPLYYSVGASGHLVWGSEIKTLLASGLIERELDMDALAQFLTWEYVPAPQTLLRGVAKLEPGHLLDVDLRSGQFERVEYWQVAPATGYEGLTDADWHHLIDETLHQSIRRQMVSDVPLGAFLSGGVDSSLIVASMDKDVQTFSIGFNDPSYNELDYSSAVAEHLGISHVTEVLDPQVADLFDHLMHFMDDPIGDFSIFPTYLVSRLARTELTVALSGDGGDELFGGYETYVAAGLAKRYQALPGFVRRGMIEPLASMLPPTQRKKGLINKVKRFAEGAGADHRLGHARWRRFMDNALRNALLEQPVDARTTDSHICGLFESAADLNELDRYLYVDTRSYLADDILPKVDRMSMAVSLETRVPFLDPELVALAFAMPAHLKVHRGNTKVLLKEIAARKVPRECVYRQKEGFSIPIKQWLDTQFKPLLDELLDPARIRREGLFHAPAVQQLRTEHSSGKANHSHILWGLTVFQAWKEKWLDGGATSIRQAEWRDVS